jgi:DNA-binding MarR family transcriptional regulator
LFSPRKDTMPAALPVSSVYLLKRAELAVRGCCEIAFAEADLTPSQYFILFLVDSGEASSSAELARSMGVLPQSMTELIAPLERKGSIARRPDPANNRILRIEITAAGRRIFTKATDIARRLERELLAGLAERDVERMNRTFEDLIAKAEAHSYHPNLRRSDKARRRTAAADAAAAAGSPARTRRKSPATKGAASPR